MANMLRIHDTSIINLDKVVAVRRFEKMPSNTIGGENVTIIQFELEGRTMKIEVSSGSDPETFAHIEEWFEDHVLGEESGGLVYYEPNS